MQQRRNIEVGGATLECTFYGSGTPVVLLANAGCSTGYFDDLARVLAAGGLQTISVNMRATVLAAGGLIGPATPLGANFRNATVVKMNGSDCVTVLGAHWLSPASDPKILAHVECWPAMLDAHLATSRGVALEDWWGAGTAPLLVIQGLDDEWLRRGMGMRCASSGASGCGSSIYLMPGTFWFWNSRKL